jgi:GT2 family glycosyltransferase
MPKFRIVVATRCTQDEFFTKTATGRSLAAQQDLWDADLQLFPENRAGLPAVYNSIIERSRDDPAHLIFVHDDVHILDYFWLDRVAESLVRFDIVGVAGNKRRLPLQPFWVFKSYRLRLTEDKEFLSGVVGHGTSFPPHNVSAYGPPRQEVKQLDGVMLCANSQRLLERGLRFDERFTFHLYDLDFCRQAEQLGLTMGTWDISIMHESAGNTSSESWELASLRYFEKWGD